MGSWSEAQASDPTAPSVLVLHTLFIAAVHVPVLYVVLTAYNLNLITPVLLPCRIGVTRPSNILWFSIPVTHTGFVQSVCSTYLPLLEMLLNTPGSSV